MSDTFVEGRGLPQTSGFADEDVSRQAIVEIAGRHVSLTPPGCQHRLFTQNVEVACVTEMRDGRQVIVRRQLRVRARCGECGCPMRFVTATAAESSSLGDRAIVVDIQPVMDTDAEDGWQVVTQG